MKSTINCLCTLAETYLLPFVIGRPKKKFIFQPSIFRSYVTFVSGLVSFGKTACYVSLPKCKNIAKNGPYAP